MSRDSFLPFRRAFLRPLDPWVPPQACLRAEDVQRISSRMGRVKIPSLQYGLAIHHFQNKVYAATPTSFPFPRAVAPVVRL